jgi:biopolymer transport protein ExbD
MSIRLAHGEDTLGVIHDINVTPFIDIILVLLIIFMIAAPLATVDVPTDLPTSKADRQTEPIILTIKSDRTLSLDEAPVSLAGLQSALDALSKGDRTQRVFVRADNVVPYGSLMDTMNALRSAGYLTFTLYLPAATPAGGARP